jgi:hypothetical protein
MGAHLSDIPGKLKTVLWGEKWLDISLYMLFLSFFISPFIDSSTARLLLSSLVFSMMMVAGIMSMSRKAALRVAAGMVGVIAISLRWLRLAVPTPTIEILGSIAVLAFMVMLTVVMLSKVFSKGQVTAHRVKGAIAVYLLIGLTFAILYGLLDQLLPNAFNLPATAENISVVRQELMTYFSFITLTTLGYGDITPTHEVTRMFAIMEGLFGQLYPATLLARLVSLSLVRQGDDQG